MNNLELLKPTKIIKSRRKTISLIVDTNADFIVRAPLTAKITDIETFIKQKSSWIIKKRSEQLSNLIKPISFIEDESLTMLGNTYYLKKSDFNRVKVIDKYIHIPKTDSIKHLISFLKKEARKYLFERVNYISNLYNLQFNSISITSAKSCWGSCSFSNKLHFSFRLIFCPLSVIDYIIIHELCHTKIKNHSDKFWNLVKQYYPDYKDQERWLKSNRAIMNLI